MKIKYTPEITAFLKRHYQKVRYDDLCGMVNDRFGTDFTTNGITLFMLGIGLRKQKGLPAGTEKVKKGFTMVKIAMHGPKGTLWKEKHRVVWEAAHGPVPKGSRVIFLDGNRGNFSLRNLAVVSNAELGKLNQLGLRSADPKVTLAGIATVRHLLAIHGRLEEMMGRKGHKNFNARLFRARAGRRDHAGKKSFPGIPDRGR